MTCLVIEEKPKNSSSPCIPSQFPMPLGQEMTANIPRMQQALGLEKLTGEQVRDYLRKMSCLAGLGMGPRDGLAQQKPGKNMEKPWQHKLGRDFFWGTKNTEVGKLKNTEVSLKHISWAP